MVVQAVVVVNLVHCGILTLITVLIMACSWVIGSLSSTLSLLSCIVCTCNNFLKRYHCSNVENIIHL